MIALHFLKGRLQPSKTNKDINVFNSFSYIDGFQNTFYEKNLLYVSLSFFMGTPSHPNIFGDTLYEHPGGKISGVT